MWCAVLSDAAEDAVPVRHKPTLKPSEECTDWRGADVCCVICPNMRAGNVYSVGTPCRVISEGERKKREGKRYRVPLGRSEITNVTGAPRKHFDMQLITQLRIGRNRQVEYYVTCWNYVIIPY